MALLETLAVVDVFAVVAVETAERAFSDGSWPVATFAPRKPAVPTNIAAPAA